LKAAEDRLPVDSALLTLALVPSVVILVWWALRRRAGRLADD
jgi:uncharacterized membrane-anchored protein